MSTIAFSGGTNSEHRVQKWAVQLWHAHVRDQFFFDLSDETGNNVVYEKKDFTKKAGYQMTESLMMEFDGDGKSNDETLEDYEEAPDFYYETWTIAQLRNAGRYAGEETQQAVEFDLPKEIRDGLGRWMAWKRDKDIFSALQTSPTKVYYVNDRSGTSTIVATDLMTLQQFLRAKTYAMSVASPKIPPIKIASANGKKVYRYLCIMHDTVAYDLVVNDPVYQQIAREAANRGESNQLFSGALLDYMGLVLQQHDQCYTITTWGASSNVYGAECNLLGRSAIIVGFGGYRIKGKDGYLRWIEKKFQDETLCAGMHIENDVNSGNTLQGCVASC